MSEDFGIIIAAKCAPERDLLEAAARSGLPAVELYTDDSTMRRLDEVASLCRSYPLSYAIHAPNTGCAPADLAALAEALEASVVVMHDIYWEDEWSVFARTFEGHGTKICVENTHTVHEPMKFMRRYGFGRCLDLEHIQLECNGIFAEEFSRFIRQASHIHLTGYSHGTDRWHTHIHHDPGRGRYFLDLIRAADYRGMVVSEAKASYQTKEEFSALLSFYQDWEAGAGR